MNVAIVQGTVRGHPDIVELEGALTRIGFDVDTSAGLVPVTWQGPTRRRPTVRPDRAVTVVGAVQKRFYRRAGTTVSRTDVVAIRIVAGVGVRADEAISRAVASLG